MHVLAFKKIHKLQLQPYIAKIFYELFKLRTGKLDKF